MEDRDQELELYQTATEINGKDEKVKTLILLSRIGKKEREIYSTVAFTEEGGKFKFDFALEKLKNIVSQGQTLPFSGIGRIGFSFANNVMDKC